MKYGSVCSGIEAATVAWEPLGWKPAFFSEIEKFPRAVLSHHYPDVPLHGDFTTIQDGDYDTVDVMVGGTPCQDFSVAGLRAGFNGDRGNLTTEYVFLAARLRPRWLVFENVPGILSSDKGRGFAEFLGQLTGTAIQVPRRGWKNSGIAAGYKNAYGLAWRVLDAQYVRTHGYPGAVPQRRRRLFLVGYLGDWRRAAAVLLESESLSGNPAPSRKTREKITHYVAPSIGASGRGFSRAGETRGQDPVIAFEPGIAKRDGQENRFSKGLSPTLRSQMGDNQPAVCNPVSPSVIAFEPRSPDGHARIHGEICPTLNTMGGGQREPCVAQTLRSGGDGGVPSSRGENIVAYSIRTAQTGSNGWGVQQGVTHTIDSTGTPPTVANTLMTRRMHKGINTTLDEGQTPVVQDMQVRRLTPTECERLMGFPDSYTKIPWRGKPSEDCPDGPRYKALGNSMAVNCMRWIGQRIQAVENMNTAKL